MNPLIFDKGGRESLRKQTEKFVRLYYSHLTVPDIFDWYMGKSTPFLAGRVVASFSRRHL